MKRFSISELWIVSHLEKAARRVEFHPEMTVIKGRNDTGKSALLKTLYWTLGADPGLIHPVWKAAAPTAMLLFEVDGVPYRALRKDSFLCLFDGTGVPVAASNGVTAGFGDAVAELLDFRLRLEGRKGGIGTPPPAFLFLPFYIDQDRGWTENWTSFANLNQYSKWKKPTVEYHIGLRDNDFYDLTAQLRGVQQDIEGFQSQLVLLRTLLGEMQEGDAGLPTLDFKTFQGEIDQLLAEATAVQHREQKLKRKLAKLYNERGVLEAQLGVLRQAMMELRKDYRFATHAIVEEHVACPTCGAGYDNSFAQRFELVEDQDRLAEYFAELSGRLEAKSGYIAAARNELSNHIEEGKRVARLLQARQGEVTLEALLQAHGRLELRNTLRDRVNTANRLVQEKAQREVSLRRKLRENTAAAAERRGRILRTYGIYMARYTDALNVRTLQGRINSVPEAPLRESGSDLPRALLAYYYAVLHVMQEYSPSAFCPIVIDSPNQQAQDKANLLALLTFIRDHQPRGAQVILGLEDDYGVQFHGRTIDLTEERRLLQRSHYDELGRELASWTAAGLDWYRANNESDEQGSLL